MGLLKNAIPCFQRVELIPKGRRISPRTNAGLRLLFLLIGLSAVPSLQAQLRYTRALIHVCDKGTVPVSVVVVEPSLILFTHNVHVDGWIIIQPGTCEQVYA